MKNTKYQKKFYKSKYLDYQKLLDNTAKVKGNHALIVLKWCYREARKLEITSNDISKDLKASSFKSRSVIKTIYENVFLDKRYFISGSKTVNGINRKIPIHNDILPLFEKIYKDNKK